MSDIHDEVKENLLYCDSYISYSVNTEILCRENMLIKYNVIERAVDEYNNKFIIVKSENYDLKLK